LVFLKENRLFICYIVIPSIFDGTHVTKKNKKNTRVTRYILWFDIE